MDLTISDLMQVDRLRKVWRAIRRSCATQLSRDPLDHLAFHANLDVNLKQLGYSVSADHYCPVSPTIIRAAKRDGLTRPLSFLDVSDTLVLKAVVDAMQSDLHRDFPECVAFGRSQQRAFAADVRDYENWFRAWMRRQGAVERILHDRGCGWIVKADISNFFSSVDQRLLRQVVTQRTHAEPRLVNLLFLILESMAARPAYCENRRVGLPQEDYDASRVLAHAFLGIIDEAFSEEIAEGRYVRWVDDFVIGVRSEAEGKQVLRRLERALENQGMYVNSGKSKILRTEHFARGLYPEWNGFLDRIDRQTRLRHEGIRTGVEEFDGRLDAFLGIDAADRYDDWDRVLRRFYTQSRHIGSSKLQDYALDHLRKYPTSARHILDYLTVQPYSEALLRAVFDYLRSPDNIYEDVEILVYEFLLKWAIPDDEAICRAVADTSLDHFFGRGQFAGHEPLTEHARGLVALLLYKFGTPNAHIAALAQYSLGDRVLDPCFARHALCVLAGTAYCEQMFASAGKLEDRSVRRLHSFLMEARDRPAQYDEVLRRYVRVQPTRYPVYVFLPARMLPLVKLIRHDMAYRRQWDDHLQGVLLSLRKGTEGLQDSRSIRILERELDSP